LLIGRLKSEQLEKLQSPVLLLLNNAPAHNVWITTSTIMACEVARKC